MGTIPETAARANRPVGEMRTTLDDFLAPVLGNLPDERLRRVAILALPSADRARVTRVRVAV